MENHSTDAERFDALLRRDPVLLLQGAEQHLLRTRGPRAADSLAWSILKASIAQLFQACIDDMLGEESRRKGAVCPCVRHGGKAAVLSEATEEPPAERVARKPFAGHLRNGKAAAAGEKEENGAP